MFKWFRILYIPKRLRGDKFKELNGKSFEEMVLDLKRDTKIVKEELANVKVMHERAKAFLEDLGIDD